MNRAISAAVLGTWLAFLGLVAFYASNQKPRDATIPVSSVIYAGKRASVPTVILRDMKIEEGSAVTEEQAMDITDRIVVLFNLERKP